MFSQLALLFYSIVYIPQLILIWNQKSSKGISLATIFLWTQADFISLAGSIFLQLNKTIIMIDWYHCSISIIMVVFCLHYSTCSLNFKIIFYFLCTLNIILCATCQILNYSNPLIGNILGWTTSTIYIFGRFPQIYKNWQLRSTKGVSMVMYIFTMLGNGFYLISIFEQDSISIYIPWITLISFSIVLDCVVLIQHNVYSQLKPDQDQEEEYELCNYSDNSSETDTL